MTIEKELAIFGVKIEYRENVILLKTASKHAIGFKYSAIDPLVCLENMCPECNYSLEYYWESDNCLGLSCSSTTVTRSILDLNFCQYTEGYTELVREYFSILDKENISLREHLRQTLTKIYSDFLDTLDAVAAASFTLELALAHIFENCEYA